MQYINLQYVMLKMGCFIGTHTNLVLVVIFPLIAL